MLGFSSMSRMSESLQIRRRLRPLLSYTRDFVSWELGRTQNPPHYLKRKMVLSYRRKYSLAVFCETGTYLGEMVRGVRKEFREIHSIELDAKLFRLAQSQFRRYPHVRLHQGDSGELLGQVTAGISDPCLFWLDAHYSGGITAKQGVETPIEREIQAIRTHYVRGSVILIDDARCFTGEGDYPAYATVAALLKTVDANFEVGIEQDAICAHNPRFAQRNGAQ
jgi:hypothetical protein